jgi:3-oxoacyl-[acyl-carrier-protein] synthase II
MTKLTEYLEEASTSGYEKINRLTMMHILANIPAATINVKYGLKGPSGCISTACATGLSAIGEAYKWIRDG